MNKKVNTVLFILGATLVNVLTIFVLYFAGIYIFALVYNDGMANYVEVVNTFIFIASVVGSFLIYRLILKVISNKINMEKYFEPIISRKKK